jgi:hypothetical protein
VLKCAVFDQLFLLQMQRVTENGLRGSPEQQGHRCVVGTDGAAASAEWLTWAWRALQHKDAEPQPGMPRGRIDMIYDNLLYGPWDLSIVWDDAVCQPCSAHRAAGPGQCATVGFYVPCWARGLVVMLTSPLGQLPCFGQIQ